MNAPDGYNSEDYLPAVLNSHIDAKNVEVPDYTNRVTKFPLHCGSPPIGMAGYQVCGHAEKPLTRRPDYHAWHNDGKGHGVDRLFKPALASPQLTHQLDYPGDNHQAQQNQQRHQRGEDGHPDGQSYSPVSKTRYKSGIIKDESRAKPVKPKGGMECHIAPDLQYRKNSQY